MNDVLTVSFECGVGNDCPMMVVLRNDSSGIKEILSLKMDEEAEELYKKLVHP